MKLINAGILLIFSVFFLSTGCKKNSSTDDYKCTTCKTTPDALAANDASSKGVYKGIVIGSTGTISFNVMNGGTAITAVMVLDGVTVNLTSNVTWSGVNAYVAPFTGVLNGAAISITFSVDANGRNPIVMSSNIPGHTTAQFNLLKETSTSLLECFEGTYETTKPETGTFNMLLSRVLGKMGGSSRKTNGTSNGNFEGTVDASGNLKNTDGLLMGKVSSDQISGSFKDSNGSTVTIKAKRTL
jgi:hypothetical protein